MVNACVRAHAQGTPLRPEQLHVAIIGAGLGSLIAAARLQETGIGVGPQDIRIVDTAGQVEKFRRRYGQRQN